MKTYATKLPDIEKNWYLIDAKDQILGRLASYVASLLIGKHKSIYCSHLDVGDHVVVINAKDIKLTGDKLNQKIYYHHTGYPGGLKETPARKIMQHKPEKIIFSAVKGMLPKNHMGRALLKKLRVYKDSNHPHEAQNPQLITVDHSRRVCN